MMKNESVFRRLLPLMLLAPTFFAACAGSYKVCTTCTIPAATHIGIRTLALANFSGDQGEAVRNRVYAKLADTKYFTLVDRNQSNIDIALGQEMELDPRYLEQLKEIHADGIITGKVVSDFKDSKGYDTVKTESGTKRKPYVSRQALLRLDFKVFDLRSGKLLAGDSISESFDKKYGGTVDNLEKVKAVFGKMMKGDLSGDKAPLATETMDNLIGAVAMAMVSEITPTEKPCAFALARDDKNGMIKKGNEFAKRGVMESAREMWEEALKGDSANPVAIHNIGVFYEAMGGLQSLKKAESQYDRATKLSDDTFYIDALARVKQAIKDREKFEDQQKLKRQKSSMAGGSDVY